MQIGGIEIGLERRGRGRPLLLLAGEDGMEARMPLVGALAGAHEVLIPSAPGYGATPESEEVASVDDIAYLYLSLLDRIGADDAVVLGFSLGGWIAAEMATKSCQRIGRLALVGPYGIKLGGAFDRDIADIYAIPPAELQERTWHDAGNAFDYTAMDEAVLAEIARNRVATARYCWEPLLHNPRLRGRLHRIGAPTLVVWGESDGIVGPDYGRAYAEAIPGARFELIERAGHHPHVERPERFMDVLERFLDTPVSTS